MKSIMESVGTYLSFRSLEICYKGNTNGGIQIVIRAPI